MFMHNAQKFERAREKLMAALALMEIAVTQVTIAVKASEKSIEALDALIQAEKKKEQKFDPVLLLRVDDGDLGLSTRSINCLKSADIYYVGELVQRTKNDLARVQHLGRKTLVDIMGVLAFRGFTLGTKLENWPPDELGRL